MKALDLLYQYQQADEIAGGYMSEPINEAIKELENLTNTQEIKTVSSIRTDLLFCPLKNSSCILSECAAYTTHKEPDIMKCDECSDTFYRGERCKNYIKGKPNHIEMSLHKNRAYCKHYKQYVFI